jgi:hypothetical protein
VASTAKGLRDALEQIPAIDQHAHPISRESFELPTLLSESVEPEAQARMREHPVFGRALRALAGVLECEPREEALAEARDGLGFDEYARRLLQAGRFEAILLDDGFAVPGAIRFDEHGELAGCPVRRVIRIEAEAERAAVGFPAWEEARARFRTAIEEGLRGGAVGLKTIAAYRSGLDLPWTSERQEAGEHYQRWISERGYEPLSSGPRGRPLRRLTDPVLVRWFIGDALRVASNVRPGTPLQVHTGFGDHDLFLPHAAPSRFRWYFECHEGGTEAPVVFLHCYPFVQEAGYLAHIYDRAHVDLSFALTFASHRGAEMVLDVLDLAPASKLLFATDANRGPELFYLGATWWRDALAGALGQLVDGRAVDPDTALRWAELVLTGNARRLYRLPEPGAEDQRLRLPA